MSSSPHSFTTTTFLQFLSITALLLGTPSLAAGPLFHFCSNPQNFTSASPYKDNLNKLFAFLYQAAPTTGFAQGSIGEPPNRPYGLSLCRGDVSSSDCKTCIADASGEILTRCPSNRGAIIWYDDCLLKYDDMDFFGIIDEGNKFYMWNVNVVSDPAVFNKNTQELLTKLADKAYEVPNLYAEGKGETRGYSSSKEKTVLYGMVQCTRDLSGSDCKICLDGIIRDLPNCCDGKEGGRVVGGSCNFRYEIYPFLKA